MINLPTPECKYGYTNVQLENILGLRIKEFNQYMTGQTGILCNGKNCGKPHGVIIYKSDLLTFLEGRPPLD